MYGRIYTVALTPAAVGAALDALEIVPATDKPVIVHKVVLTPMSDETNMQIRVTVAVIPTGGTSGGTGAAAPGKNPKNSHDAAAGFTAENFNTSRATGTKSILADEAFPSQGGFEYLPDVTERPIVFAGQYFIVGIEETMGSATVGGYAIVEEL